MRILISNDDGVYSPGIAVLAQVASEFGTARIVAPDVEQSAKGHAITAALPLSYHRTDLKLNGIEAFRVNGTPADCVALGLHHWEEVDLVLSGINLGLNIGNGIWHSGTLAAAKQATLFGCRGIAFSAPVDEGPPDFEALKPHVRRVLELLLHEDSLRLVNVNLPLEPKGMRWVRQSIRHYDGKVIPGEDPLGRKHYWFSVVPIEETEEGTDRWAIEHDFVSIMPIRLDLTDHQGLERAQKTLTLD